MFSSRVVTGDDGTGSAAVMLRVGTSGWQYRDWRTRFYPSGCPARQWLTYYSGAFATVEVNNSFYRLPERSTFERWASEVPDGFDFAVKASRYLTHYRRLDAPHEPVQRLLARSEALGARHGPVLLQLPPNLPSDVRRLDSTLDEFAGRVRVAVEFRHDSWYTADVEAVLRAHDAAMVLADRDSRPSTPLWRTASWCYVRLHSGTAQPRPCYGRRALASWVARVADLWDRSADGYVYCNNDRGGCAVRDAAVFARMAADAGFAVTRTPPARDLRVGALPVTP